MRYNDESFDRMADSIQVALSIIIYAQKILCSNCNAKTYYNYEILIFISDIRNGSSSGSSSSSGSAA